jgi:flagellar motor component MotA
VAKGRFYSAINRRMLVINKAAAGAGFAGLLGFLAFLVPAALFFVIANFFLALLMVSIGLLFYVSGSEIMKVLNSVFTIFFSNKHLVVRAAYMQDTLMALNSALNFRRNAKGEIVDDPLPDDAKISIPDNPLSHDLKSLVETGKNLDYANFVAHSYYDECKELYEFCADNYDFVSQTMPLAGLIGTVLGLISMFDTLGADITVEALSPQLALALKTTLYGAIFASSYRILAVRFEQRFKALENDYEGFIRATEVLVSKRPEIEIEK